jgi:hypothetical protein
MTGEATPAMSAVLGKESLDGDDPLTMETLGMSVKLVVVLKSGLCEREMEPATVAVPLGDEFRTAVLVKALINVAPAGINGKAVAAAPTPLSPPCCC